MELQLCRVSGALSRHERRKGQHPRLPVYCPDILRSLAYWRHVRRSGAHAASQYIVHSRDAMAPTLGKLAAAERRVRANAFARSQIAANSAQPLDLGAYAARLFGVAA